MASVPQIKIKNLDVSVGWAVRRAGQEIGEAIQEIFETAITKFYMAYPPRVYDRTYSLYEGAIGAGGRGIYIKKSGQYGYDCGIEVGSEFYSYNPYVKNPPHGLEMSPERVFPEAFDRGVHGFTSYSLKRPKDDKWRSRIRRSAPPKSSPPVKYLKSEFKKIDNADYVFNKLYTALDNAGAFIEIV